MSARRIAAAPAPIAPDGPEKTLTLNAANALGIPPLIARHWPLAELLGVAAND